MKFIAITLLASCGFASGAFAADSAARPLLVGTWSVDTSRLAMEASARPRSVTITFSQEVGEQLRTKVEVIAPTGDRLDADGVTPLDGTPTQVQSNFEADVSATTMPRHDVLIMQLAKGGRPASTRIYAVQPDGNSMIETVAYFTASGQPVLRRNYFSRVK